ncbi:molybdenum cofactor guanylyltransferase [Glaciibacter superstes]|uniref:molybdenum cofactor guanylyltransferase n=1 Tax=Glaciibacter superstes TaxID=501023 RepID=UPI0003B37208|nr:molybdenum cofactor guanylyltransferase [Glaciibacter superstes]
MLIDAIVLAGGRSSRLGSVPKAGLIYQEQSLLSRTVAATAGAARQTVVVGDVGPVDLPLGVLVTRENPPFSGPVSGIGAGLDALATHDARPSDYLLVLACDMPAVESAVRCLFENLTGDADGFIAIDENQRLQPLAAVYRTESLAGALVSSRRSGGLGGLPVFRLIADLRLTPVDVPAGSTDDVDTWADAERFGIRSPHVHTLVDVEPVNE